MEIIAYFKGHVEYIEITEKHVYVRVDYWEFSEGFAVYDFKPHWHPGMRSKKAIANRKDDGNEKWFIEFENAVRQLHIGDTVILKMKGIHSIYHIEKLSE